MCVCPRYDLFFSRERVNRAQSRGGTFTHSRLSQFGENRARRHKAVHSKIILLPRWRKLTRRAAVSREPPSRARAEGRGPRAAEGRSPRRERCNNPSKSKCPKSRGRPLQTHTFSWFAVSRFVRAAWLILPAAKRLSCRVLPACAAMSRDALLSALSAPRCICAAGSRSGFVARLVPGGVWTER